MGFVAGTGHCQVYKNPWKQGSLCSDTERWLWDTENLPSPPRCALGRVCTPLPAEVSIRKGLPPLPTEVCIRKGLQPPLPRGVR